MPALVQILENAHVRARVVADAVALIDSEVARKRGLSGIAVRAGYHTVRAIAPAIITVAMDGVIDDLALEVDPIWTDCLRASDPRARFIARRRDVARALLRVTDARAEITPHKVMLGAYRSLRASAEGHIMEAVPGLAGLMLTYAAPPAPAGLPAPAGPATSSRSSTRA